MGLRNNTSLFVSRVSVEPCLFLYCLGLSLIHLGVHSLLLQKLCSPEGVSANFSQVCAPQLVSEAADVSTTRNIIIEALNGLVVVLGGLWRDRTGLSAPLIHLAIGGTILTSNVFLVSAIFWQLSPWLTGILTALVVGFTGGKQLVFFAATCFMGANSNKEERTIRLTLMLGTAVGGGLLGSFISGYILSYLGFIYFFSIAICIFSCAIILGMILIFEKPNKPEVESKHLKLSTFLAVFKARKNRSTIWLIVINTWILYTALSADNMLTFYYVKAAYNMSVTDIGIFSSFLTTIHFFGTIAVVPLFIKFFKWSDYTLAMVAVSVVSLSAFCNAINKYELIFIASCSTNVLTMSLLTFHRSIITKCVSNEELGMFLSVCGIGEGILPIAFLPLYDLIFKETIYNLPGAFYGVTTVVALTAFINLCVAKHLHKEDCEDSIQEQEEK